jgi:hypothetical protein
MEIIRDEKTLTKAIKAASVKAKAMDTEWQRLALSAVHFFAEHGQVGIINMVYTSLGKGARHQAMTQWLTTFAGVKPNSNKDTKGRVPFVKDKDKLVDLEGATAHNWFDMAPSKAPDEVIDFYALILKAAKRTPKEGQQTAHSDFREKVLALATAYDAEQAGATEEPTDNATADADDALSGVTS